MFSLQRIRGVKDDTQAFTSAQKKRGRKNLPQSKCEYALYVLFLTHEVQQELEHVQERNVQ